MVLRISDWIQQAIRDLEHAKRSIKIRHFEWACFAAHQAAEKAPENFIDRISSYIDPVYR